MNADDRPRSTRPEARLNRPGFGPHPAQTGRRVAGFTSTAVCLVMIVAVAASARSNHTVVSSSTNGPAAARIALVPSTAVESTTTVGPTGIEGPAPSVEAAIEVGAGTPSSLPGRVTTTTTRRGSGGSTGPGSVVPGPGSPGTTAPPSGSGPGSTAPPVTAPPVTAPPTTPAPTTEPPPTTTEAQPETTTTLE